jgi:PAS domain S-box-containing protein
MPEFVLSAALDALDIGVIVLDAEHRVAGWNEWLVTASGVPAHAAAGKTLDHIFPDAALGRLNAGITDAISSGISSLVTQSLNLPPFPLKTRTANPMIYNVVIGPLERSAPFRHCMIQITDVTVATERERLLRKRQNARYDAVVGSAQDVIVTVDAVGHIQFLNQAIVGQFGYQPGELIGKPAAVLFQDRAPWARLFQAALADGAVPPTEVVALRKDGSPSFLEISAARWLSDSRVFVSAILRDVNERRRIEEALRDLNAALESRVAERTRQLVETEEALRQSQKMEAVGQLTGGIAHDFNNLLQGIIGSLDRIKKRITEGRIADVDKFLDGAAESANRAAALTHRLLAFSRRQPVDPRPVDVRKLLGSIEELVRRTIGEQLRMDITSAEDLWLVRCDANQLENALLNLAINARDASPDGGRLGIDMANVVLNAAQARQRDLSPGECVRLKVTDTGVGMPPGVITRAFDPFYTTKPTGQGTGLGLSMVYGFVKQSNGSIRIESAPGEGTTIEICFPRFRGDLDQIEEAEAEPEIQTIRNKTVLVVEDEPIVRLLTVEVLNDLGYRALEAADGTMALRILETSQHIDLLITDIGMPGLNGRQVADAARVKRPTLPILFMTGYAESASSADFLGEGMEMVTKPVSMDILTSRIRAIMAAQKPHY